MNSAAPASGDGALAGVRWQFKSLDWLVIAVVLVLSIVPFWGVLGWLFDVWVENPAYSHGIVIPIVAFFVAWRERGRLARTPFAGSWSGFGVALVGFMLWYVCELSTIWVIGQYGFIVVLAGIVLALAGPAGFRVLLVPLLILTFMIPLPAFFENNLSLQMQLISSEIGVAVIRLFGISVFLDGNVIDLGTMKLQVAEACNGLRYLYPLATLGIIVAYLFKGRLWMRLLIVAASAPIAILMNSLRIGLVGVSVEYWGQKMAEGVLHDFEGWAVFMLSLLVLLGLASILHRIDHPGSSLRNAIALDFGEPAPRSLPPVVRTLGAPFIATAVLTLAANAAVHFIPVHVDLSPPRASFTEFPDQLGAWSGRRSPLETEARDQLKTDDYLLATYSRAGSVPVNVWIPWYESQRKGQSTHSPKSCLPGGGWEIRDFGRRTVPIAGGGTIAVNRAVIEHGTERQIVYYWFQQRGRIIDDEYLVKWYIFYDAIARNRTDGAMVRLISPLPDGVARDTVERDLEQFTGALVAQLSRFVPG